MNPTDVVKHLQTKLTVVKDRFSDELKKLRTGRAHPSMLDGIVVTAYGTPMPMNQVATVTAPEPQLLQISPFDPTNLQAIASAIRDNQTLGLNPMDDGRVVRVPIPPLTTERRQQIVRLLGEKVEEAMIGSRQARHDALDKIAALKKDKTVGEDDAKRLEKQVDEEVNKHKSEVDQLAKAKEAEIMKL
jgi:ribosome recycling factor